MFRFMFLFFFLFLTTVAWSATTNCDEAKAIITQHQKDPVGKEKIAWFKKAAKLCPEVYHTHMMYGIVLEEFEDTRQKPNYEKASRAYFAALRLKRDLPEAFFRMGGIRYLEGKFATASSCYRRYLRLLPEDFADDAHLAEVNNYITKAEWLHLLPGTIRLGALRSDGAKMRAAFRFIGDAGSDVASSLYWAKGYTTGTGVGILASSLISLIAQEPEIRYDLIQPAIKNEQWDKVHQLCLNNLPRVINLRGIEHKETYEMLSWLLIASVKSEQDPRVTQAIAKVFLDWREEDHPEELDYTVDETVQKLSKVYYEEAQAKIDSQ